MSYFKCFLKGIVYLIVPFFSLKVIAQTQEGVISGNVQVASQYYQEDEKINAKVPPQKIGFNSFANLNYTKGNFSAGMRFESYEPSLIGYPASPNISYSGSGIGYRYARYTKDDFQITIGNFYDQFGNGLAFRAYEERGLGVDNAMDGIHLKYKPVNGVYLKGAYGKQRLGFEDGFTKGEGVVRAFDTEISINELIDTLFVLKPQITIGGSFVSKYQQDIDPTFVYPENVGLYAGRINVYHGGFIFTSEYVKKMNDPSQDNRFVYKEGSAFLINSSFSKKGLGVNLAMQIIDNMSFRSDRFASNTDLQINFLPPVAKQHTYNLAATLYPYATQMNGEVGLSGEINYKIPKETLLGGKYGTEITVNYSSVNGTDTTLLNDFNAPERRIGYKIDFFSFNGYKYFRDFNIDITKKWNKKWKSTLMYLNIYYDYGVIQKGVLGGAKVRANIGIADVTYKLSTKHAIRIEGQMLTTEDDLGDWTTGVIEYTFSPHWFFAVQDQYNYGNPDSGKRIHYFTGSFGYTKGSTRFIVIAGKQRAGLFCVGGICRVVPASNGVSLTITSTF